MKKDAVFYYDGSNMKRFMGFGQMLTLAFACHMKTKEMGYTYTICEWHNKVAYLWDNHGVCKGVIDTPQNWKWNITFVNKGYVCRNIKSVDLSKENSLFDGCPPIMQEHFTMIPMFEYLNKYSQDTGTYPVINIAKDAVKPYILFHYRKSEQDRQLHRNTSDEAFISLFIAFKNKYGNSMQYKKFGEPSPIDNQFDEVIGYKPYNITEVFDLVNNSHIYVGSPAGTLTIAYMLGVPVVLMVDEKTKPDYFNKADNLKYGDTVYSWLNPEKITYMEV